ncbi:MAG: hypothetical protein ACREM3_26195 [Candidatus Rokuibacteriota bacterium]
MSEFGASEQQELFERESRIAAAHESIQQSWIVIGQELRAIRERKLWRGSHQSFEAYCEERWGYSRHRAHQLITAEGVIRNLEQPEWEQENVLTAVNTFSPPTSETHVRPLTPLSPTQQRQAWQEAEATAPASGITERHVRATVHKLFWSQRPEAREPEDQRCEQLMKQLFAADVLIGDISRTHAYRTWPVEDTAHLAERIELQIALLQDTLEDLREELNKGLHVVEGAING